MQKDGRSWSDGSVCTTLGHCRQNVEATIEWHYFLFLLLSHWVAYFSERNVLGSNVSNIMINEIGEEEKTIFEPARLPALRLI